MWDKIKNLSELVKEGDIGLRLEEKDRLLIGIFKQPDDFVAFDYKGEKIGDYKINFEENELYFDVPGNDLIPCGTIDGYFDFYEK